MRPVGVPETETETVIEAVADAPVTGDAVDTVAARTTSSKPRSRALHGASHPRKGGAANQDKAATNAGTARRTPVSRPRRQLGTCGNLQSRATAARAEGQYPRPCLSGPARAHGTASTGTPATPDYSARHATNAKQGGKVKIPTIPGRLRRGKAVRSSRLGLTWGNVAWLGCWPQVNRASATRCGVVVPVRWVMAGGCCLR
jgi:hypothetical protein